MVPGTPSTIICARCGWQNDSTARMCGGCGVPLHTSDPGATSQANTTSQDAPTLAPPNAPGAYLAQPYTRPETPPPIPQTPTPVTAAAPAAWPGPGQVKTKSGRGTFRWWIVPLAILVAIIVLGGLGFGVWSFGIQPSTTSNVNATFPSVLNSAFDQVNSGLTPDKHGLVQISAATLDGLVNAKSPLSGPVTNFDFSFITVPYTGFKLTYNFNVFGTELQDTTAAFSIEGNRLGARATVVDGSMSLFESGDQMEQILNTALTYLTNIQGKVESFQLTGSMLTVQLTQS
jgi:hypothetical protein